MGGGIGREIGRGVGGLGWVGGSLTPALWRAAQASPLAAGASAPTELDSDSSAGLGYDLRSALHKGLFFRPCACSAFRV